MRPQHIMFAGLLLATGTMISLTFGGLWVGDEEVELANAVSVFKQANILGVWSVMVPNVSFFLVGARSLLMMDFAFFGGVWALVQWFLMLTVGLGLMWGFFTAMLGTVQGLFRRS